MSDFIQQALEAQLNANIKSVRDLGYEIVIHGDREEGVPVAIQVGPRKALPALPGPGAESQVPSDNSKRPSADGEMPKKPRAKRASESSGRSCRFCRRQLRGDNATGVCSSYGCRKELEKEQTKADAGSEDDSGK